METKDIYRNDFTATGFLMNETSNGPSEGHSDTQNDKAPGRRFPKVNNKPRVRVWIFWTTISGISAFFAQYIESFDSKYLLPSLLLVLITVAPVARAIWIQLTFWR